MDTQPEFGRAKFKCPNCGTVAQQFWFSADYYAEVLRSEFKQHYLDYRVSIPAHAQERVSDYLMSLDSVIPKALDYYLPNALAISRCNSCSDIALWLEREMVYPRTVDIPLANEDFDDDIHDLYYEAALICSDSPKGAAALLRLALQKLLVQIGKPGKNINNDIKELVADGLSVKIQQALDLLRVVGNNAVHPGQISFDDDREVALKMFRVLNIIADELITKPKEIDQLYRDVIPEETRNHIDERDS